MNYLAHAYLSFENNELLTGNLISDFVKGKKQYDYPAGIRKGITLHRAIDHFTDNHPATQQAKTIFREAYRLYAGAFVDVVFDHFLAEDEKHFTDESLKAFASKTYTALESFSAYFPERFAVIFPYMKNQNWLYHYRSHWGIEKSMGGVVRRAAYLHESNTAYALFREHYQELNACYLNFFPELYQFAREQYNSFDATI